MPMRIFNLAAALAFLLGLFAPLSFAQKYVYFCVGNQQICYKALTDQIAKFDKSLLAAIISGRHATEVKMIPEKVWDESTQEFKERPISHYILNQVDSQAFQAILRWIETGGSMSRITKENRATVIEDAEYLGLPELREKVEREGVCPDGYIFVPGNPLYETPYKGDNFCVMKYTASSDRSQRERRPISEKNDRPLTAVNYNTATSDCSFLGGNFHLMTNDEWMVVSRNIEAYAANWSGGEIGKGILARGNSDSRIVLRPGKDDQPHFGLNEEDKDWDHRRFHILSTGEKIWDMAGNLWQWVAARDFDFSGGLMEYSDSSHFTLNYLLRLYFAPLGFFDSKQNVGKIYLDKKSGLIRGGDAQSGKEAGIFAARWLNHMSSGGLIGYRCTMTIH